ncbi:hypothetical protein SAY87_017285 [Trapa incisa]|uniref:Protein kinase domain-containing protein n=1 Tax=Trapa incisa TaxID=236973 RepID=A0AAN7LAT6_9MYRT|nr:hypothetical protein SAY87_017285 [Trapa incisa]
MQEYCRSVRFHSSGILTKKSDVYSFGIVLLELITGRPAIKKSPGISLYIIDWVTPLVERGDIQSIVDSRLRGQLKDSAAWKVVEIAMSCISPSSCKRPNMEGVLSDLKECLRLETGIGYDNYMDNSASLEMPSAELDMAPKPR